MKSKIALTKKQKFVLDYIDNQPHHNLQYGFAYFNWLEEKNKEAQIEWKKLNKK